jgi:hypothetical protein
MVKTDRTIGWRTWTLCICLAGGVPIIISSGFGIVAGIPLCILSARLLFDWVSLKAFGKPFYPPANKWGSDPRTTRSDWILFLPYLSLLVALIFAFLKYWVWVRQELKWKL